MNPEGQYHTVPSQRDGEAALQGRGIGICGFVGQLCGEEEMYAGYGLHLSGRRASVFAEGLSGAVASDSGKDNKSPGVDGISPKILKETVELISTHTCLTCHCRRELYL